MKGKNRLAALSLALLLMLAVGYAAAEGTNTHAGIDWTEITVAVVGLLGAVTSTVLTLLWNRHVKPWLEEKGLAEAAEIAVNAAETIAGRYCGEEKLKMAIQKMKEKGFSVESEAVLDAIRSAWKK
ncbi:MAG: phage holin, LLH family, partial [Clostridia bacterium]